MSKQKTRREKLREKSIFTENAPLRDGEEQPEPTEGARGPRGCSGDADQDEDDGPAAWCVMQSDVLDGEKFLLVRDDVYSDDELRDRVTDQAREQADAVYRMTEMNHITAANLSDERKRELHELKKQFGGDVLGEDPAGERVPCTKISDWIDSVG